jgi:hypothetical protein
MKWQRTFWLWFVASSAFFLAGNLVLAAGADVVITSIKGPTKAFLNQTISVTYEVKNQGDADSGAYQVELYLSNDTTIDPAQDRLLKEVAFAGGLAAGKTKKTTTKVTIPWGGLSGRYYLGGVVGTSSIASAKRVLILRFQADAVNGTVIDHKTGLMWQQADDNTKRTFSQAKTYCEDLDLGGYDDWGLARIDELLTIADYVQYRPAIDPVFKCAVDYYWSSTIGAGNPNVSWGVAFGTGAAYWFSPDSMYYVRCVRGGTW